MRPNTDQKTQIYDTTRAKSELDLLRELRRALRHLYDPDVLRASPLTRLVPVSSEDAPSALRDLLTQAIEALKPSPTVSRQSAAYRTHYTLRARYIQQFPQAEVARALGISPRQMRRQDQLALRTLAEYLRVQHNLSPDRGLLSQPTHERTAKPESPQPPSREDELRWIRKSQASEQLHLPALVQGLLQTVQPLASQAGVQLRVHIPEALPAPTIQTAALRQALLTLLVAFIRALPGGELLIAAEASVDRLCIRLMPGDNGPLSPSGRESLTTSSEIARELVELTGGTLHLHAPAERGRASAVEITYWLDPRPTVLVVDDNRDALQLVERYLAGSRFAFVGTTDPEQTLALAERCAPRLIVLDIMLPGVDGWELLERLREHPSTCGIPVLVCTILPQEELALALGAAAFLQKPVSRGALLRALEEHLSRPRSGPG